MDASHASIRDLKIRHTTEICQLWPNENQFPFIEVASGNSTGCISEYKLSMARFESKWFLA